MLTVQRMCGYLITKGVGMKKSLCLLLTVVSSCYGFVDEDDDSIVRSSSGLTCYELLHELQAQAPHASRCLSKPGVIAALASGALATTAAVQPLQKTRAGSVLSITNALLILGFGGGVTGLLVYTFIGEEMGTIVSFKSTLKKLSLQVSAWQTMIMDLQDNQIAQEKKVAQAQAQMAKILPLMQQLIQQSSNEEILGKAVVQLNDQCVAMAQRIKSLEELLGRIAELDGKDDDVSKALKAKRIRILIKKSDVVFGKPVASQATHWWQFGYKSEATFV